MPGGAGRTFHPLPPDIDITFDIVPARFEMPVLSSEALDLFAVPGEERLGIRRAIYPPWLTSAEPEACFSLPAEILTELEKNPPDSLETADATGLARACSQSIDC